jgi:HSP20 family molecular chaperone IbpA
MARVYSDRRELPDDLQALLEAGVSPECTPPFDIVETGAGLEVLMDLPGVSAGDVDILFARNVLLIAGHKRPRICEDDRAAFHVAERAFGRFGRAITLDGAFDTGAATATLAGGELRLVLPRQPERRGGAIRIPVRTP